MVCTAYARIAILAYIIISNSLIYIFNTGSSENIYGQKTFHSILFETFHSILFDPLYHNINQSINTK